VEPITKWKNTRKNDQTLNAQTARNGDMWIVIVTPQRKLNAIYAPKSIGLTNTDARLSVAHEEQGSNAHMPSLSAQIARDRMLAGANIRKPRLFLPVVYKVSRHFCELGLLTSFGPNKASFASFAREMSKDIPRVFKLSTEC
jgi:hypothetical protein